MVSYHPTDSIDDLAGVPVRRDPMSSPFHIVPSGEYCRMLEAYWMKNGQPDLIDNPNAWVAMVLAKQLGNGSFYD